MCNTLLDTLYIVALYITDILETVLSDICNTIIYNYT